MFNYQPPFSGRAPSQSNGWAPTARVQHSERPYLSPLMRLAQKIQYWIWLAILFLALAYFWIWWLRPEHNIGTFSYVLNLIVIAWLTLLPLYFILILSRARVPAPLPVPPGIGWLWL